MEIGYYWIQIKGEAPEIAFYSKKTNMFFRIGTGIGVMCKGLIILEKVKSEGQKKQESTEALHKHGVVGRYYSAIEIEMLTNQAYVDGCNDTKNE